MTARLLTLGSCAWIKVSTLGLTPRKLKRTVKTAASTLGHTIEYQYPYVRMVPESYTKEVNLITSHLRRKLERHSTPTPWGYDVRYLPHVCMETLAAEAQQDFDDYKGLTQRVLSSWDSVHASALKDLKVLAAREYKEHDPFGFVDKKAWIDNYVSDIVGTFPGKDEVAETMSAMIVLGNYGPATVCPPGYHTIGDAAMRSWAEDYIDVTWTPVQESLATLRLACTSNDQSQALMARAQAHLLPQRVHKMLTWASHKDIILETMAEEAMTYFLSIQKYLMAPQNEDLRRQMADLALKPLIYMADTKNLKARIDYLLEDI